MDIYHPYLVDYLRFMVYFKQTYPALCHSYKDCIQMPISENRLVTLNNNCHIPSGIRIVLNQIIANYYNRQPH